jgi:GntR family transcriptional regulator/MocR family aminotransferase
MSTLSMPTRTRIAESLLIRIDPGAREPLQRQIYAGIRQAILDGVLAPGQRLPSSRALAEELGVSRTTSLLALEQLLSEGYLATRRGSGTFVASELPDDAPRTLQCGPSSRSKHPPLSRRGATLAEVPPPSRRIPGPPRPFRLGTPALDLFPVGLWSQLASRRLRSATSSQLDYGDCPALREAIAGYVESARGTRCSADEVLVVGGTQRALDLVSRLVLDTGDAAWLEEPGYPGARAALLAAGARIVPVPVDAEGLDIEAGMRRARWARLAYVTPSHQFPLGVPMSLPRRLALLKWASTSEAWVVEDDYDGEFRFGARPIPCLHGLDVDGRVIYAGSFSKALFPALRLGFLIVPLDLRERLVAARRTTDPQPSLLDQTVLADFIAAGHFERHLRRMRAAYRERLEALADAAHRHCRGALRLRPVLTGLHAVADLDGVDDRRVFQEAAARGIEATPLSMYFMDASAARQGLVLGFGSARPEALARGMERLAAAIDAASQSPVTELGGVAPSLSAATY